MQGNLAHFYYSQAVALANDNQLTRAKEQLQQSLSLKPDLWQGWNVLGLCCYRLGEFALTKEAWERSRELMPEQNPAEEYLATFHSPVLSRIQRQYKSALTSAQQGEYGCAVKILQERSFSSFVRFSNLLGLCHYALGDTSSALKAWGHSLRMDTANPLALYYIQEVTTPKPEKAEGAFARLWRGFKTFFSDRW
jgi:tetratricopeptide (TPR) repeat protein